VEKLTNLLNSLDSTGSIKFTYEEEQDGKLPFLDVLLVRTDSGSLKLCIYRKSSHTDQYLNFSSHHPVEHKLSVVRTLLERSQNLVTDSQDKTEEDAHVEEALRACGYPSWSFTKVRRQIESRGIKKKRKKKEVSEYRPLIVIPYVEKVSESIVRVMKKHNVPVAMKPWKTLKGFLVHPKDKQEKEDVTECIYKVPCANCDKTYVGETGRKLGVRLQEHRTEVESKCTGVFTRSQRTASLTEYNKSALTDHAIQENHTIHWKEASIIDREPDRATRWIKEAVHIRKEGHRSMNRDEGSYQLSHAYDRFLDVTADRHIKIRKN